MTVRVLTIAIENYPSGSSLASLKGVIDSGQQFLDKLVEHTGLAKENIVFCCSAPAKRKTHSATNKGILEGIKQLLKAGVDDTEKLYLYIAGHGVSASVSGLNVSDRCNLLLCSNFKSSSDASSTICIDELLTQLSRSLGAGDHFVFVDVCRTQQEVQTSLLGLGRSVAKTGVANQLRLSSSKPGGSADNDAEFLKVILTGLEGKGSADTDELNSRRYGSIWLSSNGKRHVHMSQRINGQDIRYASANDFIDFTGDHLPQIERCLERLESIRRAPTTTRIFQPNLSSSTRPAVDHVAASARALPSAKTGQSKQLAEQLAEQPASAVPLSISDLAERANRSLRFSAVSDLVNRKRAIIGPKNIEQLTVDAEQARQLLLAGSRPSPSQMAALEQAIRLQRPAPACVRDGVTLLPVEGNWIADRWLHFQTTLQQLQSSVARLDRVDAPDLGANGRTSWGTGFLVADDLLLTAAHVVTELSFGTGVLEPGQAEAEFEGYLNVAKKSVCSIVNVIKYDPTIDLALLQLSKCKAKPIPLEAVSRPVPGFPICVIGYPQNDPRNAADLISLIFGGNFGVKRAAVGEVLSNTKQRFTHDCSTLGGVSGGPVVDINTGKLCGVHVAGQSLIQNEAVDAQCVLEFLEEVIKPANSKPAATFPPVLYQPTPTLSTFVTTERPAMSQNTKNASRFLEELRTSDPEIYNDVKQTQETMRTESAPGFPPMSQETIVLLKGRPVLDIKSGAAVLDIAEIESLIWRQRLQSSLGMLKRHVPAVGRIELINHVDAIPWLGTGWLLRDDIVVTNRHVARAFSEWDGARFAFVPGLDGSPVRAQIDFLEEFGSNAAAEFPLFEIVHVEGSSGPDIAFLRIKPMNGRPLPIAVDGAAAAVGEQVAVIGYPARDPFFAQPAEMDRIFNHRYNKKRLAPGLVTKSTSTVFLHDCSTLGGNSGSEIVSLKTGKAVALHFAGTLFTANHAVPIHIVNEKLDKVLRSLRQTPSTRRREDSSNLTLSPFGRSIELTIPIRIRVDIGEPGDVVTQTITPLPSSDDLADRGQKSVRPNQPDDDIIEVAEARPEDYANRRGFDALFLGDDFEVPLPLFTENEDDVLEFEVSGKSRTELRYTHFSVVMSRSRRLCRYSACNIDGQQSKRSTRAAWRTDPRIPAAAQILKECYGNEPRFSRGHMTRREDPAWGTKTTANQGNVDSMHVTNTVPQMQPFNAGIWLDLEDYALQNAREDDMRISVFTGPFLATNDPFHFGVKVPVTFWKVIAFIHDETGELSATGYTMSQRSFLPSQRDEFVFGKHESNQRSIRSIATRAGLDFGLLAEIDPLRDQPESIDAPLKSLADIRFLR